MSAFAVSQILICIAAVFDLLSFQFKDRKAILTCLCASSLLVASHFFLLANATAGSTTLVTGVRFFVAYFSKSRLWMWFFFVAASLVLMITYRNPINFLPFVATILGTFGSFHGEDKTLRMCAMAATIAWITHNALIGSPAAFLLEVLFLASNLFGYWRFYIRGTLSELE